VLDRLRRKSDTAATLVPAPVVEPGSDIGAQKEWAVLSIGSCHGAIVEARDRLGVQKVSFDYMRLKAFPFDRTVKEFIDKYDRIFVVEQNRDAQLRQLLVNELELDPARLVPLLSYDGMPVSSDFIVEAINAELQLDGAAQAS